MRAEAVARIVAMNAEENKERGSEGMFVVRSSKCFGVEVFSFCKGADAATKGSKGLQNIINNGSLKTDGGGVALVIGRNNRRRG